MMGILKQGINLGQSSLPEVWRMGHCLSWYTKTDIGILKEHIILWSCVHRYVSTMCLMYVRAMCLAPRHKTLGPVSRFFPLLLSTSLQGRSPPRVVSPPLLLVQLWSLRCFLYHCVVLILLFFFFFFFLYSYLCNWVLSSLSFGTVVSLWHTLPRRPRSIYTWTHC